MHPLLEQQYKKVFGDKELHSPELKKFLEVVSETYRENERLNALDKARAESLSVTAHQLRIPLSSIKWTYSFLLGTSAPNLTPDQKTLLAKNNENLGRALRLIDEMLMVTRIESGNVVYNFSDIQIEELIENCMEDFTGLAEEKGVQLIFDRPRQLLPRLALDPDKIRSVLQNLIENSVYYSRENGRVVITANEENRHVKIQITDQGIGIPESEAAHVFDKYFRARNAMEARADGSGLGLFVARSIVEKHAGTIGFESVEDRGTTFYVSLPSSNNPK